MMEMHGMLVAVLLCACMLLVLTQTVSVAVGVNCDTAAAYCSHICEDIGDSYECRCHPGYQLADDGYSCITADGKSHLLLIDHSTIDNFNKMFITNESDFLRNSQNLLHYFRAVFV